MANVKDAGSIVMSATASHLNKSLSKWDLMSIGIGAVIGWSWVIYGGIWTTLPGSIGGVIAFLIGGILCTFVGLTYAELSSALPYAGGDIVYSFEGLGAKWAYFSGAFLTIIFTGLIIIETIMFPMMLEALGFPVVKWMPLYTLGGETIYVSYILLSMAVNLFFAVLNYRGIEFSKVFQTITVGVLLFASIFYVSSGVALGSIDNAKPFFTDFSGLSLALLMVPGFMLGFNAVAQAAEETSIKPSMIGKVVIATVWASVVFYVLIIIGTALSADAELRASGGIVVLNSLQNLYTSTSIPMYFVAIASLIGLLTSWNASYIAASRVLLSLGRGKYVTPALAKVHPQFKTPGNATIFLFIASSFGAFLGTSQMIFGSLVDVVGVITVSSWLLVAISFVRLRKLRPDLERPYKIKHPKLLGFLSIGSLVFFLLLYTPLNPLGGLSFAETLVTAILLIGVILYYFKHVHFVEVDKEHRRELLFGKEE